MKAVFIYIKNLKKNRHEAFLNIIDLRNNTINRNSIRLYV